MIRVLCTAVLMARSCSGPALAADAPQLLELRVQTVGDSIYFHARFQRPADIWLPTRSSASRIGETVHNLAHLPRLISQDARTKDVALYWRPQMPNDLEFSGRVTGKGTATFVLLQSQESPRDAVPRTSVRAMPEIAIELDLRKATTLPARDSRDPQTPSPPEADDLQSIWAYSHATNFGVLHAQTQGFGFYRLADSIVSRKYGVVVEPIGAPTHEIGKQDYQRLYETTTGAAAVTESLQLARLLRTGRKEGPSVVDITKIPGIDIAEHPWQQMMGGKKPDDEPLARFIPHDNYFVTFKSIAKFIDFSNLLDDWGTIATSTFEVRSADHRLKDRYEKQLCLKATEFGKKLGPLVIRSLAVTGNDFYLREGSDVAIVFHVANADLFRAAVQPFIDDARREFGRELREERKPRLVLREQQIPLTEISLESFVTPRREVSLHRAFIGEFVIYANSPIGVQRILDAHFGASPALAASLDYQYMRTVFRRNDPAEDGFAFLPDAFIRKLVGPASKIAEKRRLEGIAGLHLMTNAALWHALQTGNPRVNRDRALHSAGLELSSLQTRDQRNIDWDAARTTAFSERYNTIHFATPLIETPVDFATKEEAQDYSEFRARYLGLWRQYFDPVGVRFRLTDDAVAIETYILPLIQNSQYAQLRQLTGGGTIARNVSPPTAKTVMQLTGRLAPGAQERRMFEDMFLPTGGKLNGGTLGHWWIVRFDDSPMYAKVAELQRDGGPSSNLDEWIPTVFRTPITLGVEVRNPLAMAAVLTAMRTSALKSLPGSITWEPMPEYRGVTIVRIQATASGIREYLPPRDPAELFLPAIYYALVDGAWYASLQLQPIKDMIDRAQAAKSDAQPDGPQINSALILRPSAANATREYILGLMEQESRQHAWSNAVTWQTFVRAGLIDAAIQTPQQKSVLFRWLGYVPASANGADFRYDPRLDELTNIRFGSPRNPRPLATLIADSPYRRLLDQFATIQADLRFREDGIHTTVTLQRKK